MQSFPPAFLLPACPHPTSLPPPPPVRTRVSAQEPIFRRHCLVGYTTSRVFPFFFPRSSVSLPAFLLSRPPPSPNHRSLFRRPRRRRRRVVTPRIFSSYFARSLYTVGCIATFACRFIGNANFLPVHPSNRTAQTTPCSLAAFGATLDSSARRRINGKNKYG